MCFFFANGWKCVDRNGNENENRYFTYILCLQVFFFHLTLLVSTKTLHFVITSTLHHLPLTLISIFIFIIYFLSKQTSHLLFNLLFNCLMFDSFFYYHLKNTPFFNTNTSYSLCLFCRAFFDLFSF